MASNLINRTKQTLRGVRTTISARKAADIWGVSTSLVTAAIENETLWPQSRIQDKPNDKPAYGFHKDYVKEVIYALPKKRVPNQKVFNSDVRAKLQPINKRWKKRYPEDNPNIYLMTVQEG